MTPNITETGIGRGLEVHAVIEAEAGPTTDAVLLPKTNRTLIIQHDRRHHRVLFLPAGQKNLTVYVVRLLGLLCLVIPLVRTPEETTKGYILRDSPL